MWVLGLEFLVHLSTMSGDDVGRLLYSSTLFEINATRLWKIFRVKREYYARSRRLFILRGHLKED